MSRFKRSLKPVLRHEGGFVDHPKDPGGATNKGITQNTYDSFRRSVDKPKRSVEDITMQEVEQIYREQYWDAVRADDLPAGVAYAVFDAAVNSGPSQAAKWLQREVGADDDGIIGKKTIAAVKDYNGDINQMIKSYNARRLKFMKSLRHWKEFKNGWTRRVEEVTEQAVKWSDDPSREADETSEPSVAKASGAQSVIELAKRAFSHLDTLPSIGGVLSGLAGLAATSGPIQWAAAFALVAGVSTAVYLVIREAD